MTLSFWTHLDSVLKIWLFYSIEKLFNTLFRKLKHRKNKTTIIPKLFKLTTLFQPVLAMSH